MAKRKSKRVNSHRIPIGSIISNKQAIIRAASRDNLYFGWLFVLHALLDQSIKTPDEVKRIWDSIGKGSIRVKLKNSEVRRAEELIGLKEPYPYLEKYSPRTEGEAIVFARKAAKNSIHLALCSIGLSLNDTGLFGREELLKVFSNVSITIAEIESGCGSYEQLLMEIERYHLTVQHSDRGIELRVMEEP